MSAELSFEPVESWLEYLPPNACPPSSHPSGQETVEIAPWLAPEEPPSPPPNPQPLKQYQQRSFGFAHKRSIPTFSIHRQSNASSITLIKGRGSDSNSVTETVISTYSEKTTLTDFRKPKSTMNLMNIIKKKASKASRIGKDDMYGSSTAHPLIPPLPSPSPSSSFLPIPPSPPPPVPKKSRKKYRPKSPGIPPPLPSKEPEFTLDTNLDEMDGIVNLAVLSQDARGSGDASSPGSGFESSYQSSSLSTSDGGLHTLGSSPPRSYSLSSSSSTVFSNPFSASAGSGRRKIAPPHLDLRKVSPKTIVPAHVVPQPQHTEDEQPHPSWIAPESWAVEKETEVPDVPDYTSSEDDDLMGRTPVKQQQQQRRRTRYTKRAQSLTSYRLRIHRSDGSYHVVKCPLPTTVAELIPVMNHKLLLDPKRETHTLYVKERDRERALAATERPADLVRRRLEQAGYDVADGLQSLGCDEIGFLIKFIYKSNLLGGAEEEEYILDNYEYIDLTGRSLKTIPIVLHMKAPTIVTLNLSRNPMLEIPLDFIQSCGTLRELRLSNMSMKKVPQSVRHSVSLHRLDISCNRIADLDDAGLDRIPDLATLRAQNNRIDKLPWYFPRLRALKFLNISNNKFQHLPAVIPEVTSLVDLDISFNNISSLPEEIGQLRFLERFIIVGNQITKFPDECIGLVNLVTLDCRRNNITDLSLVSKLPKLEVLHADHNTVHALDLAVGPRMISLDASHNDITQLIVAYRPMGPLPYVLTSLNISHAKLSGLDDIALSHLTALTELRMDHNSFRYIPDALGALTSLTYFSCSDNQLDALPDSIGRLQNLKTLDVHNNSLAELPASMWECGSLHTLNVTSNLLRTWHDPPTPTVSPDHSTSDLTLANYTGADRKPSTTGSIASQLGRTLPPLALSLQRLYLGENRLTEEVLHPLTFLRELRVFNLSFNEIQELPSSFFRNLSSLEEIYLSGNKLSSIPTEDLHRLTRLTVLFLNGNKFQVLPHELASLQSLTVLDVGSNVLKYNINNWEFDWNWNFNENLKYLNLSGNKRLKIQPDRNQRMSIGHPGPHPGPQRQILSDFAGLSQLRVLGLMDVTTAASSSIPEESDSRRVRTSLSEVNRMPYGIADTLGKMDHLSMLDLVTPEFRERRDECIFAMFGRSHTFPASNRVPRYLCENFVRTFTAMLDKLDRNGNEGVPDALRRAFLTLNKTMHAHLSSGSSMYRKLSQASNSTATTSMQNDLSILRSGASGIVVYFVGKTIYVANAGDALAVISRQGSAQLVSRKHEPFDRGETARIRAAEGWVSPSGLVNEEIEISRSFGFYHLLPAVNPRPDICVWNLSELDEFLIIANRGLWDYVSYQTAVDIARSERADPMIAAQKLRDFAISYGADGSTMIMVVSVGAQFEETFARSRQPTVGSLPDTDAYLARKPRPSKTQEISDVTLARLPIEVPAPTGHIALAFSDIRNSTHLWEVNAGMPSAMRIHNTLLRRQLRLCGGYEVKTEGDAFMCSFSNVLSAILWCLRVQLQLLHESWPLEILECEDGKEVKDLQGKLIARGLSVRMGIHVGNPVCEPDPITHRMDYFGPMVNRTARVCSIGGGGQIMCSADVIREIKTRILDSDPDIDFDPSFSKTIDSIRRLGVEVVHVGETKLKGLEVPELLSMVYPTDLLGRLELKETAVEPDGSGSKVQFSVDQMRHLTLLCVRLEVLASCRVFRPLPERKSSAQTSSDEIPAENSAIMYADPEILIPSINEKASDRELMTLLDSLSLRIENALASLTLRRMSGLQESLTTTMQNGEVDQRALAQLLSMLKDILPPCST